MVVVEGWIKQNFICSYTSCVMWSLGGNPVAPVKVYLQFNERSD